MHIQHSILDQHEGSGFIHGKMLQLHFKLVINYSESTGINIFHIYTYKLEDMSVHLFYVAYVV